MERLYVRPEFRGQASAGCSPSPSIEEPPSARRSGRFTAHHAFLLESLLREVDFLDAEIARFDARLVAPVAPYTHQLERLDQIPGVGRRAAEQLLAELGPDMGRFPSSAHAASWTGLCPAQHESAGKTRKGNTWLRATLVECARAAVRQRGATRPPSYHHLVRRRGDKKAIVAVAHSLLVAVYHVLRDDVPYADLGRHASLTSAMT